MIKVMDQINISFDIFDITIATVQCMIYEIGNDVIQCLEKAFF